MTYRRWRWEKPDSAISATGSTRGPNMRSSSERRLGALTALSGAHNGGMATIRIAAACILLLSQAGCGYDDCGFQPIGASIRAPTWLPPEATPVGACGDWVDIDGYLWNQSVHTFELDASMLEPIGKADATSDNVVPLAAATTYAIAGVDPDEAIAMEAASGRYLVFTKESGAFPPELCPMLAPQGSSSTTSCP